MTFSINRGVVDPFKLRIGKPYPTKENYDQVIFVDINYSGSSDLVFKD